MTRKTMTLEDIRGRKAALKMELDELTRIEGELLNEKSGVKRGDIVRRTSGAMPNAKFIVERVQHMHCSTSGKPWVSGYMIKQDGSPGIQLKHLYYEWEKIEDGISPER